MKLLLKRYIYKTGLDIIAPLKCGTRWLEGLDIENRVHTSDFKLSKLSENVHSGTTFVYRPVFEHMKSAILTELNMGLDLKGILIQLKSNTLNHWNVNLYSRLYLLWEVHKFKFCNLKDLSHLIESPTLMETYEYGRYVFNLPQQWKSINEVFRSFPHNDMMRLKRAVMNEEMWLELMVEDELDTINRDNKKFLFDELVLPPPPRSFNII